MDSTTLTVLIAIAFLILAIIASWISARVGQRGEPELIDFPGSGLLIKPRRKKERFSPEWWSNWIQGLSTELVGAAIATLLIGVVVGAVQKNEADEALKRQLIAQMGSPNNDFAIEAVRQLRSLGWLGNGSLQGADLYGANLQGADLRESKLANVILQSANLQSANLGAYILDFMPGGSLSEHVDLQFSDLSYANLQNANLMGADLSDTNLSYANLQNANLSYSKLQRAILSRIHVIPLLNDILDQQDFPKANLSGANLQGADLWDANLQDAVLYGANLQDAVLYGANLEGAFLWHANLQGTALNFAEFNESTILPDNTTWTPETDMRRFTDPSHPQFWRSNYSGSPAYRGDSP